MTTFERVRDVLGSTLQLGESVKSLTAETGLLDSIPEFDSMAVVNVVAGLEEHFDITIDDEELTAEHFDTLGSLAAFVDGKLTADAA